jgi:hypothetical protein
VRFGKPRRLRRGGGHHGIGAYLLLRLILSIDEFKKQTGGLVGTITVELPTAVHPPDQSGSQTPSSSGSTSE